MKTKKYKNIKSIKNTKNTKNTKKTKKNVKKFLNLKHNALKVNVPELITVNNHKVILIKTNNKLLSVESFIFNGFIHENKNTLGINHLLEHVLVDSYKNCNKNCSQYLTKSGIKYNASTDDNIVKYYTFGLNDDLNKMLDYIVSITVKPMFDKHIIDKEKQAVYNELLAHMDEPEYKIVNRINELLYLYYGLQRSYDYAKQLKNLKCFNYNTLMQYYRENYLHNNTLFVVSGNFNKKEVINRFKTFPQEKRSLNTNQKPRLNTTNIDYKNINCFSNTKKFEFLKNKKLKGTQINLCFPLNLTYNSKNHILLDFSVNVLHYYLMQMLREKKNLVYGATLSVDTNICGSVINLFINTKNENVMIVFKSIKQIINHYKKNKISNNELIPFKKKYKIDYYNKHLTPSVLANMYGKQYIYNHFISSNILHPHNIYNIIQNINGKNIQNCINEYFDFNNFVCVYSNNDKPVKFNF